jgi:hypothetical protein
MALSGSMTSPRAKACLLLGAELDQVLRLSLVWKHVEHMITFLFDMMGDLFPLVLWNKIWQRPNTR